jgi:hypothetical protein
MTEETQPLSPIEAINEFYRLKDKYENEYYEKYVKPILKNKKSKREKRVEYSRLPKHECINCKRNVGTIFSITLNDDYFRQFISKCGDLSEPCPLDIQINYSFRNQIKKQIYNGMIEIEQIKLEIIKQKNSALFFDNKNIVSVFEKLTSKLKNATETTGSAIETDILKNDNPEKYALLNRTIDEFGKGFILPFKQMIQDYKNNNDELKINQAIKFYVDEMLPKLKEIQSLKYDVNLIEYDNNTNEYKLIQYPNSLENQENYFAYDDKVIKFVKGVKKVKNINSKTLKDTYNGTLTKNKTRKNKPVDLVIEEGDEEEIEEKVEEEKVIGEREIGEREEGERDEIEEKYVDNIIWKRLPKELQDMLNTDKEWLEEFLIKCSESKKSKQPCKLMLPKQTIFPPKLLEDGTYDFGSEIVNKLFNSQSKSTQNIWLTLYSNKDGVKNYNMLKDTLISSLEKKIIGWNNGYF